MSLPLEPCPPLSLLPIRTLLMGLTYMEGITTFISLWNLIYFKKVMVKIRCLGTGCGGSHL